MSLDNLDLPFLKSVCYFEFKVVFYRYNNLDDLESDSSVSGDGADNIGEEDVVNRGDAVNDSDVVNSSDEKELTDGLSRAMDTINEGDVEMPSPENDNVT